MKSNVVGKGIWRGRVKWRWRSWKKGELQGEKEIIESWVLSERESVSEGERESQSQSHKTDRDKDL